MYWRLADYLGEAREYVREQTVRRQGDRKDDSESQSAHGKSVRPCLWYCILKLEKRRGGDHIYRTAIFWNSAPQGQLLLGQDPLKGSVVEKLNQHQAKTRGCLFLYDSLLWNMYSFSFSSTVQMTDLMDETNQDLCDVSQFLLTISSPASKFYLQIN